MGDETASNYSIQPGKSVDYPSPGNATDIREHPSRNIPDATDHNWGKEIDAIKQSNPNYRQDIDNTVNNK